MSAVVVLVIGGVRSGKSRFAQKLVTDLAQGGAVRFVATAKDDPADPSMTARVTEHRRARPANWQTVEGPTDLAAALGPHRSGAKPAAILLDCLTLWLGNLLEEAGDPDRKGFAGRARATFEAAAPALMAALRTAEQPIVVVTNEVGQGVAPPTPLGNVFADLQGELNQAVAAEARAVYHVVAGIGTKIK